MNLSNFSAIGRTHIGNVRKQNEDSYLVDAELSLFVVADGMGGHAAGEVASQMATVTMRERFQQTAQGTEQRTEQKETPQAGGGSVAHQRQAGGRLVDAVEYANGRVFSSARKNRKSHGMGTTVVAVHVASGGSQIHIAHVGDSRCYRFRANTLEQLTRDHSVYNDVLMANPSLKPEQLGAIPRNVISRALGLGPSVKVDSRSEDVRPGDMFVLCSDGLPSMVTDESIVQALKLTKGAEEACELLLTLANDGGGKDNTTVVILDFPACPP